MKLKFLDFAALFISLCVLVVFSLAAYRSPDGKAVIHIKTSTGEWYYPLDKNYACTLAGVMGDTEIKIQAGKVSVVSSPCREKICLKQGAISKAGEWIACLPNSVLITVETNTIGAKDNAEWDTISF